MLKRFLVSAGAIFLIWVLLPVGEVPHCITETQVVCDSCEMDGCMRPGRVYMLRNYWFRGLF